MPKDNGELARANACVTALSPVKPQHTLLDVIFLCTRNVWERCNHGAQAGVSHGILSRISRASEPKPKLPSRLGIQPGNSSSRRSRTLATESPRLAQMAHELRTVMTPNYYCGRKVCIPCFRSLYRSL
ncbi:uncharacterized protein [Dermacentor albipictus]|uniref:uncharacterized protein n=1 Tax=Dermacentor albipictus TaxID=60249 RepID=UPI0031FCEDC3